MILDGHTHIFPEESSATGRIFSPMNRPSGCSTILPNPRWWAPEEMVGAMEEEGVEAAVILGFPWRQERLWRRQHEVILEAMRRWPRTSSAFAPCTPGARGRPGGGTLPGRGVSGHRRTGLVWRTCGRTLQPSSPPSPNFASTTSAADAPCH